MDTLEKNKYKYVKNIIPKDIVEFLSGWSLKNFKLNGDSQAPHSSVHHSNQSEIYRHIIHYLLPKMQEESGLELKPIYSYNRIYLPGSDLKIHNDRPSCEISASITLKYHYEDKQYRWPLFMGDTPLIIETGDGVIYIEGGETGSAAIELVADEGDDNADHWKLYSNASNNKFKIATKATGSYVDILNFTTSGNIEIEGNIVPASGKGIDFSATSGTGTSELFDDYEEGDFTPTCEFGSGGTTGMSLGTALGRYTKIGRVVRCEFTINFSAKGTSTGGFYIASLPFTAADSSRNRITGIVPYMANVTSIDGHTMAYGGTPATRVPLYDATNGSTIINQGNINDDTVLRGVVTYNAA